MSLIKAAVAVIAVVCGSAAFAVQPIEQSGRSGASRAGASALISACSQGCRVDPVHGRAALNYIATPRPIAREAVRIRNAAADAHHGRG